MSIPTSSSQTLTYFLVLFISIVGCKKDDPNPNQQTQTQQTPTQPSIPTITNFQPVVGVAGSVVTITGTNFGTTPTVSINGAPATLLAGNSDTSVKIRVPSNATTGKLTVSAGSNTATSATSFSVLTSGLLQVGGANDDVPVATTFDDFGNFYVTGTFGGSATFGNTILTSAGAEDIFILKYSSSGVLSWAIRAGTSGSDSVTGIAANGSFIFICGNFSSTAKFGATTLTSRGGTDAYMAGYNSDGTTAGAFQIGGPGNDTAAAVTIGYAGGITIAGTFEQSMTMQSSTLTANGAMSDVYILHTNGQGDVYWIKSITGIGKETITAVTEPASGTFVVGTFDHDITLGTSALTASGNANIFAYKLSGAGNALWSLRFTGTGTLQPAAAVNGYTGDLYIGGTFSQTATFGSTTLTSAGKLDIFIAQVHLSNVSIPWATRAGGPDDDALNALAADTRYLTKDRVYFTGSFIAPVDFEGQTLTPETASQKNIMAGRYNGDGTVTWIAQNGAGGPVEGLGIAANAAYVWTIGAFSSAPTLSGSTVSSRGGKDVVLWRIMDPLF